MDEAHTIAAWLRQRADETDTAWIKRLVAVFQPQADGPEGEAADKLGERLWKRFEAQIKAAVSDT